MNMKNVERRLPLSRNQISPALLIGVLVIVAVAVFIAVLIPGRATINNNISGNNYVEAGEAGNAIIASGTVIIGISLDQYEARLKRKELEVRNELSQANAADKERIFFLQKQLNDIQRKLSNIQSSLEDYKFKLAKAEKTLGEFQHEMLPIEQVKQAQQALDKGDTAEAEKLFKRLLTQGMKNPNAAKAAAHQLSQLAFGRLDYETGEYYRQKAMELQSESADKVSPLKEPVSAPEQAIIETSPQNTVQTISGVLGGGGRGDRRWYVYHDLVSQGDYKKNGEWTNYMPKECGNTKAINTQFEVAPDDINPSIPAAGGNDFIKIHFNLPEDTDFCGIAVASFADYDGSKEKGPSNIAYNLDWAISLYYSVRGDRDGEKIEINSAIYGNEPYGDSAKSRFNCSLISLSSSKWNTYCCDLTDRTVNQNTDGLPQVLKRVISPFALYYKASYNKGRREATIYLDEIYFSNKKCPTIPPLN